MSDGVERVKVKRLVGEGICRVARPGHVRFNSIVDFASTRERKEEKRKLGSAMLPHFRTASASVVAVSCVRPEGPCCGSPGMLRQGGTTEFGLTQMQTALFSIHHGYESQATGNICSLIQKLQERAGPQVSVGLKARARGCLWENA